MCKSPFHCTISHSPMSPLFPQSCASWFQSYILLHASHVLGSSLILKCFSYSVPYLYGHLHRTITPLFSYCIHEYRRSFTLFLYLFTCTCLCLGIKLVALNYKVEVSSLQPSSRLQHAISPNSWDKVRQLQLWLYFISCTSASAQLKMEEMGLFQDSFFSLLVNHHILTMHINYLVFKYQFSAKL